jgi:hypothetical protein
MREAGKLGTDNTAMPDVRMPEGATAAEGGGHAPGAGDSIHPDFSKGFNGGMMPGFWRGVEDGELHNPCRMSVSVHGWNAIECDVSVGSQP